MIELINTTTGKRVKVHLVRKHRIPQFCWWKPQTWKRRTVYDKKLPFHIPKGFLKPGEQERVWKEGKDYTTNTATGTLTWKKPFTGVRSITVSTDWSAFE